MNNHRPSKIQLQGLIGEHIAEQYTRHAGDVVPSIGLAKLHELLVEAAQAYESGPMKQREAVCSAMIAVSEFLKGQGFSEPTLAPLSRVLWSIVGLVEQNRPDPLFCEKRKKTKPSRSMENAVRQGQLAALAEAWLKSQPSGDEDEAGSLERAARRMSGERFGRLDGTMLQSARSYQRQTRQHELLYRSFEQMDAALAAEARSAGGGRDGLRTAVLVQIDALNAKAKLQKS